MLEPISLHAARIFESHSAALVDLCTESKELGHDMLWQGAPGA